jgi:hypothetical protein
MGSVSLVFLIAVTCCVQYRLMKIKYDESWFIRSCNDTNYSVIFEVIF